MNQWVGEKGKDSGFHSGKTECSIQALVFEVREVLGEWGRKGYKEKVKRSLDHFSRF